MGLALIVLAGLCVALSNYLMRKSVDVGGDTKFFLVLQQLFAFILLFSLGPLQVGPSDFDWDGIYLGALGGLLLGIMMFAFGKALEKGPSALTCTILSSSSVVPAIVMAGVFGVAYGYEFHYWHGIGSILVLMGIFWAGGASMEGRQLFPWLFFALVAFACHFLFLMVIDWQALMQKPSLVGLPLLPLKLGPKAGLWFMPAVSCVSVLMQLWIYLSSKSAKPGVKAFLLACFGGVLNGASLYFLTMGTQQAENWEKFVLFPLYSVSIIVFCNLWGQWSYHEKVNWKANLLCLLGIVVAMVPWNA